MNKTTKTVIAILIRALVVFAVIVLAGYPNIPMWKVLLISIPLSFAIPWWIEFDYEAMH